jgi:predicted transcriptional regulator
MLKVKEVLAPKSGDIWSIGSMETAYKALEIMADKNIGALLVIDEGKLVGILSERDYARKVILKGKSSRETTVGELMTREVYSLTPEMTVEEGMALMTKAHIRHMPVFEDSKLIGIITIGDIAMAIMADQKVKISDLENYITGTEMDATSDTV